MSDAATSHTGQVTPLDGLSSLVTSFRGRRVLVLGDAILDEYLYGDCSRLSPEAPVPVLAVKQARRVLGGAANTAANIASLRGHATLIALLGEDDAGGTMQALAAEANVELHSVSTGGATLRKTRVVGQQQQIVRLDHEDIRPHDPMVTRRLLDAFRVALTSCDVVVISDYAKGLVSHELSQVVIREAHEAGRRVIIDPRPQHRNCYVGCDYLTPNWRESRALLGWADAEPTPANAEIVARALADGLGTNVVLTLGAHGMFFCSRDGTETFGVPTLAREVFDVSGAGNTVVAALTLALASGADHPTAVGVATRAASVVVGKFGTATVSAEELLRDSGVSRLVPRAGLARLAASLRAKGKRVVTINGSFDLLHAGHLHILSEARRQGDVLIVGLNSDASVRSYKGPTRPLIPEAQRADMLLALRVVDYVHIFDEADPVAFVTEVAPDVHVNGAEYGTDCVEAAAVLARGGRLHLVDRMPGLSTTGLLERLTAPGASTHMSAPIDQ